MTDSRELDDFLRWFISISLIAFSLAFVERKNEGAAWVLVVILILSIVIRPDVRARLNTFTALVYGR
jgi:hypothetical protein